MVKEIEADAKTFADARRTLIQAEKKAVADIKIVDEPVTVVVSDKGWVRARGGHGHEAAGFAFKAGDALYATYECRSVDTLIAFGSNGRVYSVAVALLLTMLSLRSAGFEAFQRGSGTTHLLVSADASPLVAVLNGVFYANAPSNPVSWEKYGEIRSSFPYEWAIPTLQGDSFRGFPVCATAPEFFTKFQPAKGEPWQLREGHFPERNFEVCLGSDAAAGTGLRVGQQVRLTHGAGSEHGHEHEEFPYTVVGILQPTGSAHDRAVFTDLESSWLLHAFDRREREGIESKPTVADLLAAESARVKPAVVEAKPKDEPETGLGGAMPSPARN
jgi:hypothetical protein